MSVNPHNPYGIDTRHPAGFHAALTPVSLVASTGVVVATAPPTPVSSLAGSVALAPQIRAGKVKSLAIGSAERSPLLPDVPTIAESGYPGFEVTSWFGLSGPAGLPPEITARLNAEIATIAARADVRDVFGAQGLTASPSTPKPSRRASAPTTQPSPGW